MFAKWRHSFTILLLLLSCRTATANLDEDLDTRRLLEERSIYSPLRQGTTVNCDIYLAPSAIGGWGVYAGRDFEQFEVVEIAPRYLPMKSKLMTGNVLDDYHYGFTWQADPEDTSFGVTVFGMTMFYNHGAGDNQNVQFTNFGQAPSKDDQFMMAQAIGFTARRNIQRGEELLSSYGTIQWFLERGLVMAETQEERQSLQMMEKLEQQYCSKAYAGLGYSTWIHRILRGQAQSGYPDPHLPLQDHPTAIVKVTVQAGQILEMAPALVLPLQQVQNTPLEPMAIVWNEWDEEHKESIYRLRELGAFRMKGENKETGEMNVDVLDVYDNAVVFPVAGNIGLVRKVGRDDDSKSNCRVEITSSTDDQDTLDAGSAGLVLKLIATKDIKAGEELRLNLPESSSWEAKTRLLQHLAMTGQPVPKFIADAYNVNVEDVQPNKMGDEL